MYRVERRTRKSITWMLEAIWMRSMIGDCSLVWVNAHMWNIFFFSQKSCLIMSWWLCTIFFLIIFFYFLIISLDAPCNNFLHTHTRMNDFFFLINYRRFSCPHNSNTKKKCIIVVWWFTLQNTTQKEENYVFVSQ